LDSDHEPRRILLKVSGEIFGGEGKAVDRPKVKDFALELKGAVKKDIEMAVVVGGGNIVRGAVHSSGRNNRERSDYMGMLGTVINALALKNALEEISVRSEVLTPFRMEQVCDLFTGRRAVKLLSSGYLVILAGGTGNPYFTTDTAAALRASQIEAGILFKGTKVDGVYDQDPEINKNATKIDSIGYAEVLRNNLRVMDSMAVALCRENGIPIFVFNIMKRGNLKKALDGKVEGTTVR
jgi:uridylate kinase